MGIARFWSVVCVAGVLWSGAVSATPVTLDFEGFANPPGGSGINSHGNNISEDGFDLFTNAAFGGFASYSSSSGFYRGSVAMFANQVGATTLITQTGGGAFSILSIALATTNLLPTGTPLTITGVRSDTSIVQQAFSFDGTMTVYAFTSGFTDLVSLSWTTDGTNGPQIDNVVVDGNPMAVPVAGHALLLSLVLPALLARRRLRGA